MQIFTCHPKRIPQLLVNGFAAIAALLAASIAMPVSARAATLSSLHSTSGGGAARVTLSAWSGQPDFGPNVYIFNPSMPQSVIQATVDAVAAQQVSNQFGMQRYALLFGPGTYGT